MDAVGSSTAEPVGSCSNTMICFSPVTPQLNGARKLQTPFASQRRLFSTPGGVCDEGLRYRESENRIGNEPTILRNCFDGENWLPAGEPIQNHGNHREGSLNSHSHNEGRCGNDRVLSWAPYNFSFDGAHLNFLGHIDDPPRIPLLETNQQEPYNLDGYANYDDWTDRDVPRKHTCPLLPEGPHGLEGPNENSSLMDDYFHGRYLYAPVLKPSTLSAQQWRILEAISQRKSVFVTGSAGTGKSYLLEFAVRVLNELYDRSSVSVTASTGISACALQGRTLHSFAGVNLGEQRADILVAIVKNNAFAVERWRATKALIIDEISMIDGEFFDKLDYVARKIRESNEVFGGLQLVVAGDFFQLPPVKPPNADKEFAFEADCWNRCFDLQIELTEVFRQGDMEFIEILNEIRRGSCSPRTAARLSDCKGPASGTNDGIALTRLYPTRLDVRRRNDMELMALNGEIVPFLARDDGSAKSMLNGGVAQKEIYLCQGAQVVLVKNLCIEEGLVNGARGVVVGFVYSGIRGLLDISPKGLWPLVQFASCSKEIVLGPAMWHVCELDDLVASRAQVPLILGWALSVHKCQGMTLDRVESDLSKAFDYGMVYVALSRVKSLQGLRLTGFDPSKIKAHPKVFDFYERFR